MKLPSDITEGHIISEKILWPKYWPNVNEINEAWTVGHDDLLSAGGWHTSLDA